MSQANLRWTVLLSVNLLLWSVLGFYGVSSAAPDKKREPFANSVQQRGEIIQELKEIKALLQKQNALLSERLPSRKDAPHGAPPR